MSKRTETSKSVSAARMAVVFAAMTAAASSAANAQKTLPDAQVEANVLKALATSPDLADEAIITRTLYGTVTLSGSVRNESARAKAENLAANAQGVLKVVDELQLGGAVSGVAASAGSPTAPLVLQSDGTYAPAPVDSSEAISQNQNQGQRATQADKSATTSGDANPVLQRRSDQQSAPPQGQPAATQSAQAPDQRGADNRRPMYAPDYPGYGYPQGAPAPYPQQPGESRGGQPGGQSVIVPTGALLHVRVNRTLSSDRTPAGTVFDGILVNDVVADGQVAIPRGAAVRGTVVDAQASHALKGRGELSIQLTQVSLGGRNFPIVTDLWAHHGGDKTIETVNKTAGLGAVGAVFGALAGGGAGAAIGGGIGAAAGLGSSASSGNGQVYVPAESILTFHTTEAASVTTVSTDEMLRLAYSVVPSGSGERPYRRPYPRVYVGPGYYPGYPNPYRPYPVYPYPY